MKLHAFYEATSRGDAALINIVLVENGIEFRTEDHLAQFNIPSIRFYVENLDDELMESKKLKIDITSVQYKKELEKFGYLPS